MCLTRDGQLDKLIFQQCISYLSSNLAFTSRFALRFLAGSLKASLLTAPLSKLTSTEYL